MEKEEFGLISLRSHLLKEFLPLLDSLLRDHFKFDKENGLYGGPSLIDLDGITISYKEVPFRFYRHPILNQVEVVILGREMCLNGFSYSIFFKTVEDLEVEVPRVVSYVLEMIDRFQKPLSTTYKLLTHDNLVYQVYSPSIRTHWRGTNLNIVISFPTFGAHKRVILGEKEIKVDESCLLYGEDVEKEIINQLSRS